MKGIGYDGYLANYCPLTKQEIITFGDKSNRPDLLEVLSTMVQLQKNLEKAVDLSRVRYEADERRY